MRGGTAIARASRAALLLAAVLLAAAAVEVAARWLRGPPPGGAERVLFFGRESWRNWPDGTLRYAPRARIRSVSLFGDRVEYDVRFRTNDVGLVDDRDYLAAPPPAGVRRVALVGDSFCAGFHGGEPWIPRLHRAARARGERVALYNLGVGATGLAQFHALLARMDARLRFERIAVLPISDDFVRPVVRVETARGRLHLCPAEMSTPRCLERESRLLWLPDPEVPAASLSVRAAREGLTDPAPGLGARLLGGTHVGRALRAAFAGRVREAPPQPAWDRAPLDALRRDFAGRDLVFLQLPQKEEVALGRLLLDPSREVRDAGFAYQSLLGGCGLERADFFAHDRHPNADGYRKIEACVGRELALLP